MARIKMNHEMNHIRSILRFCWKKCLSAKESVEEINDIKGQGFISKFVLSLSEKKLLTSLFKSYFELNFRPCKCFFRWLNNQKSLGARSGLYGGCSIFIFKKSISYAINNNELFDRIPKIFNFEFRFFYFRQNLQSLLTTNLLRCVISRAVFCYKFNFKCHKCYELKFV